MEYDNLYLVMQVRDISITNNDIVEYDTNYNLYQVK